MALVIISDLHIWGEKDPLYENLLSLIRTRVNSGDTLILAGDLFDLFVGNKKIFLKRYHKFISELSEASLRGAVIHYIEGNHDFLLQKVFNAIPKMKVHSSSVSVVLNGKRFFFSHGDLVDRSDLNYRLTRAFFRSLMMKGIVKIIPGSWLDWVGEKSSQYSRDKKPLLPAHLPILQIESMRKKYRGFASIILSKGFDYCVMGHCHDLDEMKFKIGDRSGQYINVGYPRAHGTYLTWKANEPYITREPLPSQI
ncbi:MAG: metallophosphoesterase [Bdellovibrionota bacterium]